MSAKADQLPDRLLFSLFRLMPLLVLVGLLVGCGDSQRLPVTGNVKVDGVPLEKGYIIFLPQSGSKGPTAGADIVSGSYEIDSAKGLFEGNFRVEVKGWRDSKKTYEDSVTGEVFAEPEQFLPPKFNKESELTVEISADNHACDFDIKLD